MDGKDNYSLLIYAVQKSEKANSERIIREENKKIKEKAIEYYEQFRSGLCYPDSAKIKANFICDQIIDELKIQVPCANPQMNDHRIEFYNKVKKQINKL